MSQRALDLQAFQVFAAEQQESPDSKRKHLEVCKDRWDSLALEERADFVARVAAESSVITYLQSQKPGQEYAPVNYYAKFLKEQLDKGTTSKVSKRFFRRLYSEQWMEGLSEEERAKYRSCTL